MNRKEFDSSFYPMTKALNQKVPKFQADLYYSDFMNKDPRDFAAACHELSFGKAGWMPDMPKFREYVTAAFEMRREKEKLEQDQDQAKAHRVDFTSQERLAANRAAFEIFRQSRECKHTGRNCWDVEKVKAAQIDSSKDEEIAAKYGDTTPNPVEMFGVIFP